MAQKGSLVTSLKLHLHLAKDQVFANADSRQDAILVYLGNIDSS